MRRAEASATDDSAYCVEWQYDRSDDAEDRLLQVYALLLGLSGASEMCSEGPETTCYVPPAIAVCSMPMEGRTI